MSQPTAEKPVLRHPKAFSPATLVFTILLSVLGAFIGMRLITTLGISANTSVIGALIAMFLGRVGIWGLGRFRDKNRQNLAQTAISSATFGAANALLAPIAVAWAYGEPHLVWPLFAGAFLGLVVDAWVLYRCFGSRFLPATNPWPPGVAAAETIKAGDEGGKRAIVLFGATAVAAIGTYLWALPFSAAGVALIGNIFALLMWGVGLMIRQYLPIIPGLENFNINAEFIPHGVMIGAGIVSLYQAYRLFQDKKGKKKIEQEAAEAEARLAAVGPAGGTPVTTPAAVSRADDPAYQISVSGAELKRALGTG